MSQRVYPLKRQPQDERDYKFTPIKEEKLPDKVDFRSSCPPVYDQQNLGSCVSNAYIFLYRMLQQAEGKDVKIDYSRLKHYYDERVMEGTVNEDSGATMRTGAKVLKNIGVCLEELCPYIESEFTTEPSEEAKADSEKHKILAYKSLSSVYEIKHYLAKQDALKKPMGVAIGMEVYESMESDAVAQTGIVPLPKYYENMLGGHAVAIVGYDDNFGKNNRGKGLLLCILNKLFGCNTRNEGYFIVRNSWGCDFGDKGYFYLPYSFFEKHAYDFWVIE
jgi:C1A family cysteine protease